MQYKIIIKKKTEKNLYKLPLFLQKKLVLLVKDLKEKGPIQSNWPNFSKLSNTEYHCHFGYSWVACWENELNSIKIEVYYVGSREKAPY